MKTKNKPKKKTCQHPSIASLAIGMGFCPQCGMIFSTNWLGVMTPIPS